MARVGGRGLEATSDDDLIEIHVNIGTRYPNNLQNLLNPQQAVLPAQSVGFRPSRRSEREQALRRAERQPTLGRDMARRSSRGDQLPVPGFQHTTVIDLTDEPDSPEGPRPRQLRGVRHMSSHQASTPELGRSSSARAAPGASFIDLTGDSPEMGRAAEAPRQPRPPRHHHHHHHHHHRHNRPNGTAHNQILDVNFLDGGAGLYSNLTRGVQQMAGLLGTGLFAFNAPHRGAFNPPQQLEAAVPLSPREPSPKPPMEAVPPTRDGFTRNTWSAPEDKADRIAVCPACLEELAYDPVGKAAQSSAGGGRRRKRAPGEHHFWAIKKCGHVYCADCFESRRPTKAAPNGVGFRMPAPNDLRCAVEDCESKVSAKTDWVGIYL